MASLEKPAPIRPQPCRPQPVYAPPAKSSGLRHFPVELEVPSVPRVSSFDHVSDRKDCANTNTWRSGSQRCKDGLLGKAGADKATTLPSSTGLCSTSKNLRHFPVELEVPSIPRVSSFDHVSDRKDCANTNTWRSGSQEPFQTQGSVISEDALRPSPSAFQSVSSFSNRGNMRGSLRSLPDAGLIIRGRYHQVTPPKDPTLAIDQLCAELELNTEEFKQSSSAWVDVKGFVILSLIVRLGSLPDAGLIIRGRYHQVTPPKDPTLAIDQLCAELELNTEQVIYQAVQYKSIE
ncbi:unnamed protein product [Strongylus vulgaris]|uniref:Uncharacterized protein n=1 Tax=Strongylus vulgaris TaxID=40348 RepID=A0A3P7LDP6_STRVU|nr:unnamed protein product [Strongylus vulgaris]